MDRAMYYSITVYSPRAPKTMKNKGVGHLKTRWLTTKTSKNVGTLGARAHGIYLLPYPFKTNPSIPPKDITEVFKVEVGFCNVETGSGVVGVGNSSLPSPQK